MKLVEIDKARYRKHLNQVIVACVIALTLGSLGIAQVLIQLFPDADGSHFHWNLSGVVVTCLLIGLVLKKYKTHPYMTEVSYVWDLKQSLNKITRKMAKLKQAAEKGDVDAMTAIQYSYAGSRQLWQLDDNTITMEDLALWQAELDVLAKKYQVEIKAENYNVSMLSKY
ncbi:DUF3087 domain-containing protein [Pseudoalteromonas piscicida]|uniref:DUF3087 domain-containing protein n=1 Tax=Pseudoalteromonas piscicida TaxID=43662 RepID=A0A2A5JNW6_PSEO7|nr:DUF3087 domain-containing protein [Pseudoalteromonas piscicida]PCK31029.1 hypothetical protein CEX98_14495 [Pseudoalteromonas piscicida]